MPKLPIVSVKKIIKVLSKLGFNHIRTSGSHAILSKENKEGKTTIPVPIHQD